MYSATATTPNSGPLPRSAHEASEELLTNSSIIVGLMRLRNGRLRDGGPGRGQTVSLGATPPDWSISKISALVS